MKLTWTGTVEWTRKGHRHEKDSPCKFNPPISWPTKEIIDRHFIWPFPSKQHVGNGNRGDDPQGKLTGNIRVFPSPYAKKDETWGVLTVQFACVGFTEGRCKTEL